MNEKHLTRWIMQSARTWRDLSHLVKETGIDAIDHDHKTLTEYALKLNTIIEKYNNDFSLETINTLNDLLVDLYIYTKEHFEREEALIEKFKLSMLDVQIYEHEQILNKLKGYIDSFNQGKVNVTKTLKLEILEWIVNHINYTDFKTFELNMWKTNLLTSRKWDDVKDIIKKTGIEEIDNQHKEMTLITLDSIEEVINGANLLTVDEVKTLITKIRDYALYHFDFELKFMKNYKIPHVRHEEIHHKFIALIDDYINRLPGAIADIDGFKLSVIDWWIAHINNIDNKDFSFEKWATVLIEEATTVEVIAFMIKKTGIGDIDNDHLKLVGHTLELNKLIVNFEKTNHIDKDEFFTVFNKIYDFTKFHFEREEKIMMAMNSVDFKSHKDEHDRIVKMLADLGENFTSGRMIISSTFKLKLLDWWINHTNTTDYKTFVEHNPVKG